MFKFKKAVTPPPLFPEKFVNYKAQKINIDFELESKEFYRILDCAKNETELQKYIKENNKLFIPYSVLNGYPFYNHGGAYLFKEQKLGTEYQVDYCLLASNSDGYHLLLVEFEEPNAQFVLAGKNGETEAVRKGLIQIDDWKNWMDANREYFFKSIGLYEKGIDVSISRIHYILVVSRRKFMNERAKILRSRKIYENNNLNIITYDRLIDNMLDLKS